MECGKIVHILNESDITVYIGTDIISVKVIWVKMVGVDFRIAAMEQMVFKVI